MKKLIFILALMAPPAWAGRELTAAASSGGKVAYLAFKETKSSHIESLALMKIETENLNPQKIPLPEDLDNREIFGIVPGQGHLLLFTQWTAESPGSPEIRVYDFKSKKWSTLGEVACPYPRSISVDQNSIKFDCEPGASGGKSFKKRVKIDSGLGLAPRTVVKPQLEIDLSGVTVSFQKDDFQVSAIVFKSGNESSTLKFSDLKF